MAWTTEEIQAEARSAPRSCAFIYPQNKDGTPAMNARGGVQLLDGSQVPCSNGKTTSEVARFKYNQVSGFWTPDEPLDELQDARCHAFGRAIIRKRLGC